MPRESSKGRIVGFVALGALVAIVVFALVSQRDPAPRSGSVRTVESPGGSVTDTLPDMTGPGLVTDSVEDVALSPQARLLAERFMCICGCQDVLAVCTCTLTPGSRDMKRHLQTLVDEGKTPSEVEAGMVSRYGEAVLR